MSKKTKPASTFASGALALTLVVSMAPVPVYAEDGGDSVAAGQALPDAFEDPVNEGSFALIADVSDGDTFSDVDPSERDSSVVDVADGVSDADSALDVEIVDGALAPVSVPAGAQLAYTGEPQRALPENEAYTLSGDIEAVEPGDYTVTATLNKGFAWDDGTSEPKEVSWSIVENDGSDEPLAAQSDASDFSYTVGSDGGVTIDGYSGADTEVEIPSEIDGKPVASISDNAFKGSAVQSVVIPDSVTSIGSGAFSGCSSLASVTIPEGVNSIGRRAFADCFLLDAVSIPSTVSKIDEEAFYGCEYLRSINIPAGVTKIGSGAFDGCYSLEALYVSSVDTYKMALAASAPEAVMKGSLIDEGSGVRYVVGDGLAMVLGCDGLGSDVVIPESIAGRTVTYVGGFSGYDGIASVAIPEGVTEIGEGAFRDCSSLDSVSIPKSITVIGDGAFFGCKNLGSVTIPEGLTEIGAQTFVDCQSMTSVAIPSSVTSIGDWAFSGCIALQGVDIPNSVISIGNEAFSFCAGLSFATIPNSVTSIGDQAFMCCQSLWTVEVPGSVTEIGTGAFSECPSLRTVILSEGVTSIGDCAFVGCRLLESVALPSTLTEIGFGAFIECPGLQSIAIPEGVTSVGERAFYGCSSLPLVVLPSSVTEIGPEAFMGLADGAQVLVPSRALFDLVSDAGCLGEKTEAKINLAAAGASLSETSFIADGSQHRPVATLTFEGETLVEGVHYSVSYPKDSSGSGKYSVTFTGMGEFAGEAVAAYSIEPAEPVDPVQPDDPVEPAPAPDAPDDVLDDSGLVDASKQAALIEAAAQKDRTPGTGDSMPVAGLSLAAAAAALGLRRCR